MADPSWTGMCTAHAGQWTAIRVAPVAWIAHHNYLSNLWHVTKGFQAVHCYGLTQQIEVLLGHRRLHQGSNIMMNSVCCNV